LERAKVTYDFASRDQSRLVSTKKGKRMKKKSMKKKQIHQVKMGKGDMRQGKSYGHSMISHNTPEMSHSARRADLHKGMAKHGICCS
jgi:hypothetical protein